MYQNQQKSRGNRRGRNNFPRRAYTHERQQNQQTNKTFYKGGKQFGSNHLTLCPAKDKICTKCEKRGHFARVCRSTNVNYMQETGSQQEKEEENSFAAEDNNDPVAYAEFMSTNV